MKTTTRRMAGFFLVATVVLASPPVLAWEKDGLRIRGRLITRYEIEDDEEAGRWTDTFFLDRARLDLRWQPVDKLRLGLEIEGAGAVNLRRHSDIDPGDGFRIKDAYGRYAFLDALKVTVGQFKKPFSRTRLASRWDLVLPRRGLLDRYVIRETDHGGFGGRDIGAMISGRVGKKVKFRYFLGVFNGPGFIDDSEESHRDYVGRLQFRAFKGFVVAVHANHKVFYRLVQQGTDPEGNAVFEEVSSTANVFGADIRLTLGGFRLTLEGAYGDFVKDGLGAGHILMGGHATASYRIKVSDDVAITPAVVFEMFDPDDELSSGTGLRLGGGVRADIGAHVSLFLYAEGAIDKPLITDPNDTLDGSEPLESPTRIFLQFNLSV